MALRMRHRRMRRREHSLIRMLPNALTTLALTSGMSAIRFAILHRWEAAVIAIGVAATFDVLDGRTARLLKAQSKFGAELDSLSDVVCFGVAPAILLYLWGLHDGGSFGWLAVLAFGICAALRLARFNTALAEGSSRAYARGFFTGVPTPAAAGLALLPMIVDFEAEWDVAHYPFIVGLWTIAAALLMVSTLPTFSWRIVRVRQRLPVLALIGIVAGAVASAPWSTLVCLAVAYLVSLPLAVWHYNRLVAVHGPLLESDEAVLDGHDGDEMAEIHDFPTKAQRPQS